MLNKCIFCGEEIKLDRKPTEGMSYYWCCKCNMSYGVHDLLNLDESQELNGAIFYYMLHNNNGKCVCFVPDNLVNDATNTCEYVKESYLLNLIPKTFSDKVDKILLNLSLDFKGILKNSSPPFIKVGLISPLIFFECNMDAVLYQVNLLKNMGYLITKGVFSDGEIKSDDCISLSHKAWERLDELQKRNEVLPQAFIAMSFSKELNDVREQIKKAISDCGYTPVLIDEKEHNNQIVPEIFYEIRKSQFVVADLTENRGGVYYEAGYAEGLDKEVIISYRKPDDKNQEVHFDVAQISSIRWKNEEDLYDKLKKRIEATVGRRNI